MFNNRQGSLPSTESWCGGPTNIGVKKLQNLSPSTCQKFGEGVAAKYKTSVTFTLTVILFDKTHLLQVRLYELPG